MRRRILTATLAITVAALIIFGVPLGLALGRVYRSQQLTRLQQAANLAAASVPAEGLRSADPIEPPAVGSGVQLAYYDLNGALVAGRGSSTPDVRAEQGLAGRSNQGRAGSRLVVVESITANEATIGAVEASSRASEVTARTAGTWLAMAILALAALGVAAGIAVWQAGRLVRPVDDLVEAADRLGQGDFALGSSHSGIAEIDRAGSALEATGTRLGQLMERERAFTANASHQMRTPLTALRLTLENAQAIPGVDLGQAVDDAIVEVDRLADTVEQLFVLARTGSLPNRPAPLGDILAGVELRWHPVLADCGRRLNVTGEGAVVDRQTPATLAQVLDILVDNAARHGRGMVAVTATARSGGVSIDVQDEGDGIGRRPDLAGPAPTAGIDGHGLGLGLARSLIEAAGGRLVFKRSGPGPVVAVILP